MKVMAIAVGIAKCRGRLLLKNRPYYLGGQRSYEGMRLTFCSPLTDEFLAYAETYVEALVKEKVLERRKESKLVSK